MMSANGKFTAEIARSIIKEMGDKGYDVYYDHEPSGEKVGKVASWFGNGTKSSRGTELSQLDIAIVHQKTHQAIALVEIEETSDTPKTLLGDAMGVLLGDHISFGKKEFGVGENTTLIILALSHSPGGKLHDGRNAYLRDKIMRAKNIISTGNAVIGNVVIKSFSSAQSVKTLLRNALTLPVN